MACDDEITNKIKIGFNDILSKLNIEYNERDSYNLNIEFERTDDGILKIKHTESVTKSTRYKREFLIPRKEVKSMTEMTINSVLCGIKSLLNYIKYQNIHFIVSKLNVSVTPSYMPVQGNIYQISFFILFESDNDYIQDFSKMDISHH